MARISALTTHRELDLEARREELRNSRWGRQRSMILMGVFLLATALKLCLGVPATPWL